MNKNMKINPNNADKDTLQKITGVGPVLAERIIAARPFEDLDGLRNVQGISDNILTRITPHISLSNDLTKNSEEKLVSNEAWDTTKVDDLASPVEENERIETSKDPSESDEPVKMVEEAKNGEETRGESGFQEKSFDTQANEKSSELDETTESKPEPRPEARPRWVTMNQALWLAFGSGLIAFVLALVISLGILGTINGGRLIFANPTQIRDLNRQVGAQESALTNLGEDLDGIRERVDNLETVSGRVTSLEESVGVLDSDLNEAETRIADMDAQINETSAQIQSLEEQNGRFENFFTGLSLLLSDLFQVEEEK